MVSWPPRAGKVWYEFASLSGRFSVGDEKGVMRARGEVLLVVLCCTVRGCTWRRIRANRKEKERMKTRLKTIKRRMENNSHMQSTSVVVMVMVVESMVFLAAICHVWVYPSG